MKNRINRERTKKIAARVIVVLIILAMILPTVYAFIPR